MVQAEAVRPALLGVWGQMGTLGGLYQHPARTLKEDLKGLPRVPPQDGLEGDVGFDAGT